MASDQSPKWPRLLVAIVALVFSGMVLFGIGDSLPSLFGSGNSWPSKLRTTLELVVAVLVAGAGLLVAFHALFPNRLNPGFLARVIVRVASALLILFGLELILVCVRELYGGIVNTEYYAAIERGGVILFSMLGFVLIGVIFYAAYQLWKYSPEWIVAGCALAAIFLMMVAFVFETFVEHFNPAFDDNHPFRGVIGSIVLLIAYFPALAFFITARRWLLLHIHGEETLAALARPGISRDMVLGFAFTVFLASSGLFEPFHKHVMKDPHGWRAIIIPADIILPFAVYYMGVWLVVRKPIHEREEGGAQ